MLCALLQPTTSRAQSREYHVDATESRFNFTVDHFGVATVNGSFLSGAGVIFFDPEHPDSMRAELSIDVQSVDTGNGLRDKELRSEDFLDVRRYPTVSFNTTGMADASVGADPGIRMVRGLMTLYGNTMEIEVPVHVRLDPSGRAIRIESDFNLSRKDFDLKFGILMDSLVGDEIRVSVSVVGKLTER